MNHILVIFLLFGFSYFANATDYNVGEVTVTAVKVNPDDNPNELVGNYKQPRWTAMRAFSNTRSYVIPEGTVGIEYWIKTKVKRSTNATYYLTQREVEVGLGHRFQLDFYHNEVRNYDGNLDTEGYQIELRWAPANWGDLPLNPTLYGEYHVVVGGPDKIEGKLLLSDSFWQDWRFGLNLIAETELWGPDLTHETAATLALGKSICHKFTIGGEFKGEASTTQADRNKVVSEYYLGPSIRWQPLPRANILFTSLIGLNNDSNKTENLAIFSLEL